MITLHQPPSVWGLPSISPFATKLEAYLRLIKEEYQVKAGDPRKAPKGKVPYIDDNGTVLGDSQFIIEHLKRTRGDSLDGALTPSQLGLGHSVRRMLEDGLYWNMVYLRWISPEAWGETYRIFSQMLPMPAVLLPIIRWRLRKALHAQGTLRHSPAEIHAQACADLTALSQVLAEKPYLLGDSPTSFDCSAYAFVAGISRFPVDSLTKRHLQGLQNLLDYAERFHALAFAGWTPRKAVN